MQEIKPQEQEREEYGKKRVWEDCKHGRWLSPCPICAEEKKIAEQGLTKFKREHFIRIDVDKEHYYYSFGVPGFEICLEPCVGGFDVRIYDGGKRLIEPGMCTNSDGYLNSAEAMFGDRTDEDWNKALSIANELLNKFADKYVRELLDMYPAGIPAFPFTGMKCVFCGCTDNNACPGGCSWAEPNVCSRCKDRLLGNDMISGEEIKALRARAKTITMKDGLHLKMQGWFIPVIPMDIKSGYGVSLTIIDNPPDRQPIEVFSVGHKKKTPDAADADHIALAVLGKGYVPMPGPKISKRMVHYWKRRE